MSATVLQPSAGQTVVQTTDEHNRHNQHTDPHRVWEVSRDFASVQTAISTSATATGVGLKDAQAVAYQVEGRALLEAAKNTSQLGNQATSNFNLAAIQATNNFNLINVELVKNAAAAELTARMIAADAAKQAAECCCELKALILSQGETTRALIRDTETQNLRDKITRLELQNASFFTRNVAPSQPVQAQ